MSLIVVSNRLPVTIGKTIEKSSGGLVYAMEGLDFSDGLQWLGWAGGVVDDLEEQGRITTELTERFNYRPVFLTGPEVDDYYTGYSNSSLWPLLHYITTYARYEESWWEAYQRINRLFAQYVLDLAGTDGKRHVIIGHDRRIGLGQTLQRKQGCRFAHALSLTFT